MPSTKLREQTLLQARRVIVKIGTQLLTTTDKDGSSVIDTRFIGRLAGQVMALRERDVEVTLVSSGAVGAGCVEIGQAKRPTGVAELQAIAAIGQRRLMGHWHDAFRRRKATAAQLLLTRADFDDRQRFLNIRNCLVQLHAMNCIPILNENDTVAVDEIRFGDNDLLAALTCNALRADALILLTGVDGLLDAEGKVVEQVEDVVESLSLARRDDKSTWGSGGMMTKLEAAKTVTDAGEVAVVANGRTKDVLPKLLAGENIGTIFVPAGRKLGSRDRWIGMTARPAGTVSVDDGATQAITTGGKSLLPSGVIAITGSFEAGDILMVRDARGKEIARGLTNYTTAELRLIAGKRSKEFAQLLGRAGYNELIHRDNLVPRHSADR